MAYTLQELGSAELISMYQEYLELTDKLAEGKIDQLEALDLVDSLGVVDAYENTWKVDPNSGTFLRISPSGGQEVNVDPLTFHPTADDNTDVSVAIPSYRYKTPSGTDAGAVVTPNKFTLKRKILWGVGGVVGAFAIFLGGFALATSNAPEPAPAEAEVVERPVVEDPGPTPERVRQVLDQLGSGDASRMNYAVPNATDEGRLNWAFATLGSVTQNGYSLAESRTEEGVSTIEVRDSQDNVVMVGDLEWEQDAGGNWVLAEAPLLAPPGDELPEPQASETTAPESEDGADASEAPAEGEAPEGEAQPADEPPAPEEGGTPPPAEDAPPAP